jgi:release factor glutamine methyltransferase
MSENFVPKASITINSWVLLAAQQLKDVGITSGRLDAEIIVCHVLVKPKTWLIAHSDQPMELHNKSVADIFLNRRLNREPLAYIIGSKEFYGRSFEVSEQVLIPRPETETLITLFGELQLQAGQRVIDVGTGSGCIGLTIKAEFPLLDVTLSDVSHEALAIATQNARRLALKTTFVLSDVLATWEMQPGSFDYIVANLPYVDHAWDVSPETAFEPRLALFAENNGLQLIYTIIEQAQYVLRPSGYLLLEADTRQLDEIARYSKQHGFIETRRDGFCMALRLT